MSADRLREMLSEATPGPWHEGINHFNVSLLCIQAGADHDPVMVAEMGSLEGLPVEANAALVALAPDAIALLADMGEALAQAQEAVIWLTGLGDLTDSLVWTRIRDEQMPEWRAAAARLDALCGDER